MLEETQGGNALIVLVCGSRTFGRSRLVRDVLDRVYKRTDQIVVWSGGATGPDSDALAWARNHELPWVCFRPVWHGGHRAGFDRNEFMVERLYQEHTKGVPTLVCAFWDRSSRGTRHTIHMADLRGLDPFVWSGRNPGDALVKLWFDDLERRLHVATAQD